jgi:hypothetical protein
MVSLLRNSLNQNFPAKSTFLEKLECFFWVSLFALIGIHFNFVFHAAINVPFSDEWEFLNQKENFLSWKWLFSFHNEHRIVFTKLITLASFYLDGWNIAHELILSFGIFLLIPFALAWASKRTESPTHRFYLFPAFLLFLLTPNAYENHTWALQSSFHFFILFGILGGIFIFLKLPTLMNAAMGSAFLIFSMYSLSGGVVLSTIVLSYFLIAEIIQKRKSSNFKRVLLSATLTGSGLLLWFVNFSKPAHHPVSYFPWNFRFWDYFLNILSLGFGFDRSFSWLPGLFVLFVFFSALGIVFNNKRLREKSDIWFWFAFGSGVLAVLASISVGRAGFHLGQSKSSRYSEIGLMLIPTLAVLWNSIGFEYKRLSRAVLISLWIFCFLGLGYKSWHYNVYPEIQAQRITAVKCIRHFYQGQGDGNCPEAHPLPIGERLRLAQELKLSFADS